MYQVTKKISASGLLLLVAMPLFFSVFFVVRQKMIQEEAIEKLEAANLQTITLPIADVHWVKADKEVVIKGRLFDVRSFSQSHGQISLTGLYDTKENDLVRHLSGMVKRGHDDGSGLASLTIKFLFFPVFNEHLATAFPNNWTIVNRPYAAYVDPVASVGISRSTPPPRSV